MSDQTKTLSLEATSLPVPTTTDTHSAVLVVVYPPGPLLGRRLSLSGFDHIIGRLPDLELSVDIEAISRQHARMQYDGAGWIVEDLGSTNGTFVNDVRVVSPRRLADGDLIRVGKAILKFLAGNNVEASYHEEIYRMTVMDALTGVHNKRHFIDALTQEIARATRHGLPLSLVMFDIDFFKRVNDTHGHLAGDAVLRDVGHRLQRRLRKGDLAARYGGEEFGVILPHTNRQGALVYAEGLRKLMESESIAYEQLQLQITVSLGVAELDPGFPSVEGLIARADAHLYDAKRSGRNRVVG
jgi:diguanylate cyclase (GGDEF)-like protein